MTSAVPLSKQTPPNASQPAAALPASTGTTSTPLSGAVPAQLPARSYANATKTASQTPSTPAVPTVPSQHNVKSATESPVNGGTMAQGGPAVSAAQNGTPSTADHGRKPSRVFTSEGASGATPNGGPVNVNGSMSSISFGSMALPEGAPAGAANHSQSSSLPAPPQNPRVISPAHTPSPIPQVSVSGGHRPPSALQSQSNGAVTFGSMGPPDAEQPRPGQIPGGPLGPGVGMHERRQSSQSMQSDVGGTNRTYPPNVPVSVRGGRGFVPQQPYGMSSPATGYRQPSNPGRGMPPSVPPQFAGQMPPGSPYGRGRNSPAVNPAQPNMSQHHMPPNAQMQYGGYPQQMGPQQHPQGMYPHFDPQAGYYQPYPYGMYGHPPQSPRPGYPIPYNAPQQGGMQPPYPPPAAMSRSTSTASERPPSSMGHQQPQTPSMHAAATSQTPATGPPTQPPTSQFVKPKSTGVRITDAQGNVRDFKKTSAVAAGAAATTAPTAQPTQPAQPQTPVIVSTPNAPTPPPRAPSGQHNRVESKSVQSIEETKNAFKRQVEEKRKAEEAEAEKAKKEKEESEAKAKQEKDDADAKAKQEKEDADAKAKQEKDAADAKSKQEKEEAEAKAQKERELAEAAARASAEEAAAEAEKAAANSAGDEDGVRDADAAVSAVAEGEGEKTEHEETEDERMERMIAEMEAAEAAEEEREKAYAEKSKKEKEAAAAKEAARLDEELKRQEREAEEREAERERERNEKEGQDTDEESRALFASLKKTTGLGPGADVSAPESGTETPVSTDAEQASPMPPPAQLDIPAQARTAAAPKPKPAHLKLETAKRVEPSEPTPGMQALKSARFLELQEEAQYPDGFKSPNPALNLNATRKGRAYDKTFLLQFQNVFKEKPSIDWDQKIKETLGSGDEPRSARTPSTNMGRSASGRPGGPPVGGFSGQMGTFGTQGMRTLPSGTTSEQRFAASSGANRPGMGMMPPPIGGRVSSSMGMAAPGVGMSRTNSLQTLGNMPGPNSPRQQSTRGGGKPGSRRGDRALSKKEEADLASKMPLTAHLQVTPLEKSSTGWVSNSAGRQTVATLDPSGNMAPDMVQRKVKAALNKMTPENFEKISDQILQIAAQSKSESDGRTLRQVIQLTFEKACDEAHWAGMYAGFCAKMLTSMSPEIRDETIKDKAGNTVSGGALFRKYLLNRCQEEFEKNAEQKLTSNKDDAPKAEAVLMSDEYYVQAAAKRKALGLIQFIGQLYRLRMLTLRIMHDCVMRVLDFEGEPDEASIENFATLLKSVGPTMEGDEHGRASLKLYFDRIDTILEKYQELPSRARFMLMDLIDLRRVGWKSKDDAKGPKTIQQIHAEAEAAAAKADMERQRQAQRGGPGGGRPPAGRGDARNFSGGGMPPPVDYQRTTVGMEDLRRLQNRSQRQTGPGLGPSLGPSSLGARSGSRRGAGNLAGSGNTTRTNTPPVDKDKKEEPSSTNAFGALASLDPSGEAHEDAASHSSAASPPASRQEAKSEAAEKAEEAT